MIQEMIAESSADIRALRLMALHSAWVWDTQGASKARLEIAELKFWGAEVLHDVHRPRHPGARCAGLVDGPPARQHRT